MSQDLNVKLRENLKDIFIQYLRLAEILVDHNKISEKCSGEARDVSFILATGKYHCN